MAEQRGSLEPGKQADFVLLSADPYAVEPHALSELEVSMTFFRGRLVYQRD